MAEASARTIELREERAGSFAELVRWLDEHGWFEAGLVRQGKGGRFEVEESHVEFFLARARGLGLRVAR